MRKNVFGRKFKRDINERKALFKSLLSSLVLYGRIKTTEAKAKAIKGEIDSLVTKAKKGGNNIANLLQVYLIPQAIEKLMTEVAPRFQARTSGYTRMIRLGRRLADNAPLVQIEWVEMDTEVSNDTQKTEKAVLKKEKKEVVLKAETKKIKSTTAKKRSRKPKIQEEKSK